MFSVKVAVLLALVGVAIAAPGYEHHDYHVRFTYRLLGLLCFVRNWLITCYVNLI